MRENRGSRIKNARTMQISRWAAPALLAAALPAAAASTIVPAHPTAQQAVELRLSVDSCSFNPATVQVSASGSTLRLTQRLNNCLVPGTAKLYDVRLGNFPAGDYRVEVYSTATSTGTPTETLSFTVSDRVEIAITPPPVHPLTNYSGFWWNPDVPGTGMALTQTPGSDALFGALYRYDGTTQLPVWFSLEGGHWTSPTTWQGAYIRNVGPAGHVTSTALGAAMLDFSALATGGRVLLQTTSLAPYDDFQSWVRFVP
jgi:hypothetical protein